GLQFFQLVFPAGKIAADGGDGHSSAAFVVRDYECGLPHRYRGAVFQMPEATFACPFTALKNPSHYGVAVPLAILFEAGVDGAEMLNGIVRAQSDQGTSSLIDKENFAFERRICDKVRAGLDQGGDGPEFLLYLPAPCQVANGSAAKGGGVALHVAEAQFH